LLHISEIKWERLETLESIMAVGDKLQVKLLEVDKKTGKYRLSAKALLPKPEGFVERPPREPREGGGDRGGYRGGNDRGGNDRRDDNRNR
jgi:polyribonucleotide nucleotidyltransferase